ncbi:MAG TPA: FAD-binding oxidoreductase, partial [Terriglobales bacterium]
AQHGQRLALDPLWPERATVAGIISSNDSGSLRLRYGGVRDLIIGVTTVLPDGTIAKSGGKVVKNVAGYDLPKLMTGAFGTLAVITKAVFRLHPLPEHARTMSFEFETVKDANDFMLAVADSTLVPTGMQLRIGNGAQPQVDVRFEAIAPSIDAQVQAVTKLAGQARECAGSADVWNTREQACNANGEVFVCKISMLPSGIGATAEMAREVLADLVPWAFVAQSCGLAALRIESRDEASTRDFIASLRAQLAESGGSLVVLSCPAEWKKSLNVWGAPGSAQALMKRIKERFDPKGTLNRGRFVGGI